MSTIEGDFNSLPISKWEKDMLQDAYDTITSLKLWDWMRKDSTPGENGFMFSRCSELDKITNTMKYNGHSGSSFALTMRAMETIAKQGWSHYVSQAKTTF